MAAEGSEPYGDLYENIDRQKVECLNESPEHTVSNIFSSGGTFCCFGFLCFHICNPPPPLVTLLYPFVYSTRHNPSPTQMTAALLERTWSPMPMRSCC